MDAVQHETKLLAEINGMHHGDAILFLAHELSKALARVDDVEKKAAGLNKRTVGLTRYGGGIKRS